MATIEGIPAPTTVRPNLLTRLVPNSLLAAASAVLALVVIIAIVRGRAQWGVLPPIGWVHLISILGATLLTPLMLVRRKGDRWHRTLGYGWTAAMLLTALTSLFFSARHAASGSLGVFSGDFSPIHALSVLVIIGVPRAIGRARQHDRAGHERGIRGLVIGALLVAGFFTLPLGRLLGRWLFG